MASLWFINISFFFLLKRIFHFFLLKGKGERLVGMTTTLPLLFASLNAMIDTHQAIRFVSECTAIAVRAGNVLMSFTDSVNLGSQKRISPASLEERKYEIEQFFP